MAFQLLGCLMLAGLAMAQGQAGLGTLVHSLAAASDPKCALGPDQEQYWTWSGVSGSGGVFFRRSRNNGETFEPSVLLDPGFFPTIASEGDFVCVVYQSRAGSSPAVVARVSLDRGASFLPAVDLSVLHGGGNTVSMIEAQIVGGVLKTAWARNSGVYFSQMGLTGTMAAASTLVDSTTGSVSGLSMSAHGSDVMLGWHSASNRRAGYLRPLSPWSIQPLGSNGSVVEVACSQGVGVALWTEPNPSFPVANVVHCVRWNGSGWGSTFAVVGGSAPSQPFKFDDLRAAAIGINFYLLCSRDANGGGSPTMKRAYVAKSYDQGVTWTSSVVDTDPLVGAHDVTNTCIATSPASANGDVAILWNRDSAGMLSTRFLKSLDGGVTWLAACGGDPACQEPVFIAAAGAVAEGLYMNGASVVAAVRVTSSSGGLAVGSHSMLIAGSRRYEVCDAANPATCGGSAGTSIGTAGIPWVDPLPSVPPRSFSVSISSGSAAANILFGFADARLFGLQGMFSGFLPHIDLNAPIVFILGGGSGTSLNIPMPNGAVGNLFGVRLYVQGVFIDLTQSVLSWTSGLEIRVN